MNVHGYGYGYWYADKTQGAHPHQYMNVGHCHSTQEHPDPYDMHLHHHQAPFTNVTLFELAPLLSSPTSTCTSSLHSSNSESSSPGPCGHSEDATSDTLTAPLSPSKPQTEPPARSQSAETPVRRPGPRRPSSELAPVVADHTNTGLEGVGRRAPKPRRTPRAVQPLACFFCRGRKIACGPPVNLGTGDRTCEYVRHSPLLTLFLSLRTRQYRATARTRVSITGGLPRLFSLSIFGRRVPKC
ncbi:hypothetical protein H4582DRAFT_2077277 [Lactarius indigo]|nr:hypothetical protein H4582DRAFT_2077277 [Lactarius indigo]